MATRILSHGDSGRHDDEVLSKLKTRWKFHAEAQSSQRRLSNLNKLFRFQRTGVYCGRCTETKRFN